MAVFSKPKMIDHDFYLACHVVTGHKAVWVEAKGIPEGGSGRHGR